MNIEQAYKKTQKLQDKIGTKIPKYNAPIKAIIVAPVEYNTIDFLTEVFTRNQPFTVAREKNTENYDSLAIFESTDKNFICYEWYDSIFDNQENQD